MRLLALETATEACSAALWLDGEITERFEIAPRGHGDLILTMIDALLSEAGIKLAALDALAFGRGPGAFTGVRIATGVVQGLAFGAGLPVVPVSTLATLAQTAHRLYGAHEVLAAIDARMHEVYIGAYRLDGQQCMRVLNEERVCPAQACDRLAEGVWLGAGSGFAGYADDLQAGLGAGLMRFVADCLPHAQDLACIAVADFGRGLAVSAEQAQPIYLRDEVAWRKRPSTTTT